MKFSCDFCHAKTFLKLNKHAFFISNLIKHAQSSFKPSLVGGLLLRHLTAALQGALLPPAVHLASYLKALCTPDLIPPDPVSVVWIVEALV